MEFWTQYNTYIFSFGKVLFEYSNTLVFRLGHVDRRQPAQNLLHLGRLQFNALVPFVVERLFEQRQFLHNVR